MDKLSIFATQGEVTLTSEEGNTLDSVVEGQEKILTELKITRKGNEAFVYGEEVEDSDEVDLEEVLDA